MTKNIFVRGVDSSGGSNGGCVPEKGYTRDALPRIQKENRVKVGVFDKRILL